MVLRYDAINYWSNKSAADETIGKNKGNTWSVWQKEKITPWEVLKVVSSFYRWTLCKRWNWKGIRQAQTNRTVKDSTVNE